MRCHSAWGVNRVLSRRNGFGAFFTNSLSRLAVPFVPVRGMSQRNVASLYTLVCFGAAVVFLLAGYWSASTERFALRTREGIILQRVRNDASSLKQLVNATHRLDQKLRDAKKRVLRLTRDKEELKNTANKFKKMSMKLRKQRNALINERQSLDHAMAMLKDKKGLQIGLTEVDIDEMYDEESYQYT